MTQSSRVTEECSNQRLNFQRLDPLPSSPSLRGASTINPLLIVQEAEHERSSRILHERKKNTQDETSMKLVLDRLIRKPPNQAIMVIRQPN